MTYFFSFKGLGEERKYGNRETKNRGKETSSLLINPTTYNNIKNQKQQPQSKSVKSYP